MSAEPSRPLDLDRLRRAVSGAVFGPGDGEAWDGARRPWSVGVDQHPAAVVEVAGADDVAAAIGFARENGLGVMAQPTGHAASWDLQRRGAPAHRRAGGRGGGRRGPARARGRRRPLARRAGARPRPRGWPASRGPLPTSA